MNTLFLVDAVLISLILSIGIVANTGFFFTICKSEKLKTFHNALHINLAVFDTLAILLTAAYRLVLGVYVDCCLPHQVQVAAIVSMSTY